MTKTELMENYTMEQLAEMVVVSMESKEDNEKMIELITSAGKDLGKQLDEKQSEIARLQQKVEKYKKSFEDAKKERELQIVVHEDKEELERAKNTINQIDDILEKLFGVRHDTVDKPDEFEKILAEKSKGNITDFLPEEPIKVADILINADGKYERIPIAKAISGNDKGTYRIFDISELRQIAEHLLVYCNNQKESVNE